MNPFSLDLKYDPHLADIISKIARRPVTPGPLKDLLAHLPIINLRSDIAAIKMALLPLFSIDNPSIKVAVNHIIYDIALSIGPAYLDDIQISWIFYNIDSTDDFASSILSDFFTINGREQEFAEEVAKHDPFVSLKPFIFLLARSSYEHYIDFSTLPLTTPYELDSLYRILELIRRKGVQVHTDDSHFARICREIFQITQSVTAPSLLELKYSILFDFYYYIDKSIYLEAEHLSPATLVKLLSGPSANFSNSLPMPSDALNTRLVFSNSPIVSGGDETLKPEELQIRSIEQFVAASPYGDPTDIINNNMSRINMLDVLAMSDIDTYGVDWQKIIDGNISALQDNIESSLVEWKGRKTPMEYGTTTKTASLVKVLNSLEGNARMFVAALIGEPLEPSDFSPAMIEKDFESAVEVFPLEFLLDGEFNCDYTPLFKKYPQVIIENGKLLKRISSYEWVLGVNTNIASAGPSAISAILKINDSELLSIYGRMKKKQIVLDPILYTLFLYKLRDSLIESRNDTFSPISYQFVKANFFSEEFILFLINSGSVEYREGILAISLEIIRDVPIVSTTYLSGPVFDTAPRFFKSVETPVIDPLCGLLYRVYRKVRRSPKEEMVYQLLHVLLYKPVKLEGLLGALDDVDLGANQILVDHLQMLLKGEYIIPSYELLRECHDKALDVLLRNYNVSYRRLHPKHSSKLSPDGLRKAISIILSRNEEEDPFVSRYSALEEYSLQPIEFADADCLLDLPQFRDERLSIYAPLIDQLAQEVAETMTNTYSFSKLEKNADDGTVFEMMVGSFVKYGRVFWPLLIAALHRIKGIYIPMFIEDMIIRQNATYPPLPKTFELYSPQEQSSFALALPSAYKVVAGSAPSQSLPLKALLSEMIKMKAEGMRLSYHHVQDAHHIQASYTLDSVRHTAKIVIPENYPFKTARIEFDYKIEKSPKLYLKLNELLRRTGKFIEILFLWKINIDERFAGHSECLICYFIQEPKFKTFADFTCPTCKNMFHERCIYEWARAGDNDLCPLCRVKLDLF